MFTSQAREKLFSFYVIISRVNYAVANKLFKFTGSKKDSNATHKKKFVMITAYVQAYLDIIGFFSLKEVQFYASKLHVQDEDIIF